MTGLARRDGMLQRCGGGCDRCSCTGTGNTAVGLRVARLTAHRGGARRTPGEAECNDAPDPSKMFRGPAPRCCVGWSGHHTAMANVHQSGSNTAGCVCVCVCAQSAAEHKAKGNEFFQKEKFQEALQCYNEAIKVAPDDGTLYVIADYSDRFFVVTCHEKFRPVQAIGACALEPCHRY